MPPCHTSRSGDDPLAYTRFLLTLYTDGKASWNGIDFHPSPEIHQAAGTLRFKGILDIRPADQLWFLTLADHFRNYLNFLTAASIRRRRHVLGRRKLWQVQPHDPRVAPLPGRGPWLRSHPPPHFDDLFTFLKTTVQRPGTTYLYVNNTYLHKKNHNKFKGSFPTHFIVLTDIRRIEGETDMVDIIYWDYGGRTLRQVSLRFLKKITFGVTHCTPTRLMRTLRTYRLPALAAITLLILATSCARLNIANYYRRHQSTLDGIESTYRDAYTKKPFSIEFSDRSFDRVSWNL